MPNLNKKNVVACCLVFLIACIASPLVGQSAPPQEQQPPKAESPKSADQDKPGQKKTDQDKAGDKADKKEVGDPRNQDDKKTGDPKKSGDSKPETSQPESTKPKTKQDANSGNRKSGGSSRQGTRSTTYRQYNKENPVIMGLFSPAVGEVSQATVSVLSGSRRIAYGSIVDSNGFILTKNSELKRPLKCKLPGNRVVDAEVYGIDPQTDLALLKIDEQMLPFIRFDNTVKTPPVGSWIACAGTTDKPISIGVVSVAERKIPPASGFMGVQLGDHPDKIGVPVNSVMPGLPADDAGVLQGDIILSVNGTETPTRMKLIEVVSQKRPGTKIQLEVLREKKKVKLEIILGNREELNKEESARSNLQNTMSGSISERRKDFPIAFRHDGVLVHSECGGPVVNLDGQVIGVNIARGGRVESLTLPNAIVASVVNKLKTGKYRPEIVNKEKIEVVKQQLASIKEIRNFDSKKQKLAAEYEREEAVEEQLQKVIESIQQQLEEARKAKELAEAKLKELKRQYTENNKQKEKLEKELERLTEGMK